MLKRTALLCLLAFGCTLRSEAYEDVDPLELLARPHHYWSQGVVFRDIMTQYPAGKDVSIADEDYFLFETRQLGEVWIAEPAKEELRQAALDEDYIFTGSVLNRRGTYYVVVYEFEPAIEVDMSEEGVADISSSMGRVSGILDSALQGLYIEAEAEGLTLSSWMDEKTEEHERSVREVLRDALLEAEEEYELPAREIFLDFLTDVLKRKVVQAVLDAESETVPKEQPEAAADTAPVDDMSAEEPPALTETIDLSDAEPLPADVVAEAGDTPVEPANTESDAAPELAGNDTADEIETPAAAPEKATEDLLEESDPDTGDLRDTGEKAVKAPKQTDLNLNAPVPY